VPSGPLSTFIVGGARSGKSGTAQRLATATGMPVTVIVTADVELAQRSGDLDLIARIEKHKIDRPEGWTTIEAGAHVVKHLVRTNGTVIVDCVTMWLGALMMNSDDDLDATEARIGAEVQDLIDAISARSSPTVVVSNEVGLGVIPATTSGATFRDLQGRANQILAAGCDRAVVMIAGQAVALKPIESIIQELQ